MLSTSVPVGRLLMQKIPPLACDAFLAKIFWPLLILCLWPSFLCLLITWSRLKVKYWAWAIYLWIAHSSAAHTLCIHGIFSLEAKFGIRDCFVYGVERASWGSEREVDVECGSIFTEQQDPWLDEVVQGHSQRHLLSAQDPLKPNRNLLHQKLVSSINTGWGQLWLSLKAKTKGLDQKIHI